jgi:hypothetical protein
MSGRRRNVWNMSSITRRRRRRKGGGGRGGGRHHDARLLLVNAPSRTFSHLLGTKHTPLVPHIPLEHPRHTTTSSERFPKTQRSLSQAARGECCGAAVARLKRCLRWTRRRKNGAP